MEKTGVFATEQEAEELRGLLGTPLIMVGGRFPPNPQAECHRIALGHGLPEVRGYYGVDLETLEFLRD